VIVAAIDLGTNTTRLLVAEVTDGTLRELHRATRITRLGERVDARGSLLPAPIARVRNALTDYRRTAESFAAERTLLIATSAVRDAENGAAFLEEIEWSHGFATRLLSGDDEAGLMLRGVGTGRALGGDTLVLDIGGGSTELIAGGYHESLELGSVRHTERFLHGDPPAPPELAACATAIRSLLADRVPEDVPARVRDAVGVAGTVTTLAALDLGLADYDRTRVHGHRLSRSGAQAQLERLAALPLAERRRVPALEPERAPVIVAGAVILVQVLEHVGLDAIEVSEHDILDGAALAAAELPEPGGAADPAGAPSPPEGQ
jgi:exopolyphosphatase / guanosine-5'-triphosphate,3'-diphosphate pyrophosphatase